MSETVKDPEARIRNLIEEVVELSVPSADTDLFETGILDSLGMVDLLARIEQTWGMQILLEELELDTFHTTAGIASFVASRIPEKPQEEAPSPSS